MLVAGLAKQITCAGEFPITEDLIVPTGNIGGVGHANAGFSKRIIQPLGSQLPDQLDLVSRMKLL